MQTHTHTDTGYVEAASCSDPRLGDDHDAQQDILVKNGGLLVAVLQN